MQLRIARHTDDLERLVRFYRDGPDGFHVVLVPRWWSA